MSGGFYAGDICYKYILHYIILYTNKVYGTWSMNTNKYTYENDRIQWKQRKYTAFLLGKHYCVSHVNECQSNVCIEYKLPLVLCLCTVYENRHFCALD